MVEKEGFKQITEIGQLTPQLLKIWDVLCEDEPIYEITKQVFYKCPIIDNLVEESKCKNCRSFFGFSSDKRFYCLPKFNYTQAKRKKEGIIRLTARNDRIRKRIIDLKKLLEEEGGGEINQISLNCFFDYLNNNPTLDYPQISLTPDNDIYAVWNKTSIRFKSDGTYKIVQGEE